MLPMMTSGKSKSVAIVFFLSLLLSIPSVCAAESTKDAVPSKSSGKAASRDLPIKNIFDSSDSKVEAVADSLEYSKDSKKMIARGNAVITYQKTRILADYAEVETDAKKAYAKGHVMIFQGDAPRLQGEEIYYDFGNHTGSFPNARAMNDPWYAKGADIRQIREGVDKIQNGSVTTCNLEKPHYEIRSKKATLYVDEKIVMYSVTIRVLGKPVFWLPMLNVPLNWPSIPVQVNQGYSKKNGVYFGLMKGVTLNKHLWGKAMVDWRQKRGIGGGWKQYYHYGKWARGNIKLYWTQDKKAPTMNYIDPATGQAGNPFDRLEERKHGRGEITWRHRTDLDDKTSVLLRYQRLSDPYFLQEFFEREYRGDIQPHSFVTTTRNAERYGAMIHLEKKMNSYETMVERLPEVRLDWKNQPFYKQLVYNESRVQFDSLKLFSTPYSNNHKSAVRTDAYSRWYMPLKWNDFSFTPYAGYRGTEYSQQYSSNASRYRNVIDYGADLRTHFYKTHDVSFEKMGIEINQLRHIAVPSLGFQGATSTVNREKLIHFDTVDMVDDAAKLVLGLENRLQTKRVVGGKMRRVDVVSLNTYLFYDMIPSFENPYQKGPRFSTLENKLILRPYEWLETQTRVQFDFASHYLKRTDQDFIVRKGKWRFIFGYSQVHDFYDYLTDVAVQKSQQFIIDARYKINPLWMAGGYIRWDTADRTRLNDVTWNNNMNSVTNGSQGYGIQEWELSAIRDLHDFLLEFGLNSRHSLADSTSNNKNKMNYTVFAKFSMKGLPVALGQSGQTPFCAPRIGETVAGSNESGGLFDAPMLPGDNQLLTPR
ncbi:MAG: LPS assembly protein LptD [Candidatus Omnitrophota bacterium]